MSRRTTFVVLLPTLTGWKVVLAGLSCHERMAVACIASAFNCHNFLIQVGIGSILRKAWGSRRFSCNFEALVTAHFTYNATLSVGS